MMTAGELASYYRAAVEYIDPRLREDCPVEDIRAAAAARRRALEAHDSTTARLELEKIDEALQFISRIHPDVTEPASNEAPIEADAESRVPKPVQVVAEAVDGIVDEQAEAEKPEMATAASPTPDNPETPPEGKGMDRRAFLDERRKRLGEEQEHSRELAAEVEQELHTHERADRIIGSLPDTAESIARELDADNRDRSAGLDFRGLMEKARSSTGVAVRPAMARRLRTEEILSRERRHRRIPEEYAAPILLGILLVIWQALASILAGYAVCRLLAWPFGTGISALPPFRILFAFLLGIGTAALVLLWFRSYRRRSHRLSLPAQVTALSGFLLMLGWQLRASSMAEAGPPPVWLWCLLFACWIVATIAAGIHDLRVPPPEDAGDGGRDVGTEPAGHLHR